MVWFRQQTTTWCITIVVVIGWIRIRTLLWSHRRRLTGCRGCQLPMHPTAKGRWVHASSSSSSSSGILLFTTAGQWLPSLGRRQSTTKNSGHCCSARHPWSSCHGGPGTLLCLRTIVFYGASHRWCKQPSMTGGRQRPQLQAIFEAAIDGNHVLGK